MSTATWILLQVFPAATLIVLACIRWAPRIDQPSSMDGDLAGKDFPPNGVDMDYEQNAAKEGEECCF